MPLDGLLAEKVAVIEQFMLATDLRLCRVLVDAELRVMLRKAVARMADGADFEHLLVACDAPFTDALGYFDALSAVLGAEIEAGASDLEQAGIRLPPAAPAAEGMPANRRFLMRAEQVAAAMPEDVGALVFWLEPERIDDAETFRKALGWLIASIESAWLRFIVIEDQKAPLLDELARDHARVCSHKVALPPEEIEKRLTAAARSGSWRPDPERRRSLAMLASFATARGEHADAVRLLAAVAEEAEAHGSPDERATTWYNLGTALIAADAAGDAVGALTRACTICLDHGLMALAPMAYANLGTALHRAGERRDAIASLKVARDMFRAQNQKPFEAHVYDRLAALHQELGELDEAEHAWRWALRLYEDITSPTFDDLRRSGCDDIRAKLAKLRDAGPR